MLTALPTASIIRAALWGFGQLFTFSEFFDNPGQSLIQSAKYLLSWFRIGRYQCPPRKEPQDTRFATSPTRHRIAGCERSVRAVRFPETQVSIVSIALRDQLIRNILVWVTTVKISLSGLVYVTGVTVTGVTFLVGNTSEDRYIRSYVCHWCYCH